MARLSDINPEAVTTESVILNWLKVAAQGRLSAQLLHDSEVRVSETLGLMTNELVVQLETKVLAHKVESFEVEGLPARWLVPRGRVDHLRLALSGALPRVLIAALALVGVVIAFASSVALGVVLCVVAVSLIAFEMREPRFRECEKAMTVTVDRWATFPENTYVYPDHMGPPRYVQMVGGQAVYEGEARREG